MKPRQIQGNNRHLQESLKDCEARCQLLLDSSLDCIIWTDQNARITEFNAAAERVFRVSRSSALGTQLADLILPPRLREQHQRQLFATADPPGIELVGNRIETTAIRSDGKEFPAEFTVTRVVINQQAGFVVHVRDITARKKAEEAVVWMAAVVESSQDAIIGKDLDGRIISWNKGAEIMYGYTAGEIIGQHVSILCAPERSDEVPEIMARLRKGSEIKRFETIRKGKDGRLLNVSLAISPVRNSSGEVIGASAIARDITAEKIAQEALRKANETSIYSSPVPIVAADLKGRVIMWNGAAEAVFGWSEEEVIGKPLPNIPVAEANAAAQLHSRLLAGETLTGIEVRRQRRNGSPVTISLSASPLWNEHHQVKGIIGFLTDITDRKNAEEAIRKAEEKYRSIFENAVEGIYQAAPDGKYLSTNSALARMMGFGSPEELMSAADLEQAAIHPELHSELIRAHHERRVVRNFEYELRHRDGKQITLSASGHATCDENGQLLYFEGTVQDVTERRQLELQLQQMQKMEAIGRLAGGVAHDFNNILMAVGSYAELLDRKLSDNANRGYVNEILKAVNRGSSLTQGLLTFSRKQVSCPKVLDLNVLISEQLDMLRRLIAENIELRFIPASIGKLKADPTQMEQVVMNLVINARDAMPNGGIIAIETRSKVPDLRVHPEAQVPDGREHVVLTVSDNGCGMDSQIKARLFEPFYTTKEVGKGTGLGLATVFGIVKQSMGEISVESEPKRGTTFRILLPCVEEAGQLLSEEERVDSEANGETILLVEDETAVRESTAEYLSECGYTVLKAARGKEALRIAAEHSGNIHLLLSDLVMPEMSGREVSEKIAILHPETKTMFMSGYSNNVLSKQQLLDPGHTLVHKPIRLSALSQNIRRKLSGNNSVN